MPTHVVYGDSFLVAAQVRRLRDQAGANQLMDSNRQRLNAADTQPVEALQTCNSLPFLDPLRLVEIEGALTTQESARPGRAAAGRNNSRRRRASGAVGWPDVAAAVPELPASTLLIFIDGDISKNNAMLRALNENAAETHEMRAPTGQGLSRWVKITTERKGGAISPPAIQEITDIVGDDLWTLDRELEKLALYAAGREITAEDVRSLVHYVQDANVFAAVDAIIERRPGRALGLCRQLLHEGREPLQIIALIERQLRLMALARDLSDRKVARSELGRRMGVNSDFVVRKTLGMVQRTPLRDIESMYRRVLESDLAIKRGELEPALSLELLVADLATGRWS